jgi:hypothetical protein
MSGNKRRRTARANASTAVTSRTTGDALTSGAPGARHGTPDTGRPPRLGSWPMWLKILDVVVRVIDVVLRLS